jgi:hypothetical protein
VPLLDALDLEACATCYGKLIPELERVRTLSIALGTSECIAHLDDPAWRNVRELTIRHTPVGKAMNQLCGWKTIKPRVLRLLKASIAETGARVLASAKLDVEVLDLRDNPIGDEAEAELRAVYGARVVLSDDDVGKPPKKAKARAATR